MTTKSNFATERSAIIDIFLRMSVRDQYRVIGYLSEYADRNFEKQRAAEQENHTCQTSAKIIQFPAIAARQ